ncbi:MAG: hypothetical protein U5M23_05285 [Marinagarivorans sp.]|nr:hypothetical protein [Marinagarivorans sp.]
MLALLWTLDAHAVATNATLIDRVLIKADEALLANRLTQPQHNNAYDRYRAVQSIDPSNARAQAGLEKIFDAYVRLAEAELQTGSPYHAQTFVSLLESLYPGREKVRELRRRLASIPRAAPASSLDDYLVKSFDLNPVELQKRSESVKQVLVGLAQRVEKSHESIVIAARNDAEGRWIYQIMNKATPNYRVRGDMQIRSKPAIKLLEPL